MTEDARVGIAHSSSTYDIISVDAYRPPYIPWHLTTRNSSRRRTIIFLIKAR